MMHIPKDNNALILNHCGNACFPFVHAGIEMLIRCH
jgi:hypothetical protein